MGYVFKKGVLVKKEDSGEQKPAGTPVELGSSKAKSKPKKEEKTK